MDRTSALDAPLLGREAELDLIRSVLADVAVRGSAILFKGDAGIGKSALLTAAGRLGSSAGVGVLVSSGSEAESHLPFAALYELLRPLLTDLETLPTERQVALTRAFGLSDPTLGPAEPDRGSSRFFIGLAAQDLLATAATQTPLLVLADDIQWWDPASREVLAFVARRIAAMPVVIMSAARVDREESDVVDGLGRSVRLRGLDPWPAQTLLREHGSALSAIEERRLLDVARGNPLALIELPIALSGRDWEQRAGLGLHGDLTVLPLTARLERAFAARLKELHAHSRSVLLVAAALDSDLVREAFTAASFLLPGMDIASALDAAVEADLIRLDGDASHAETRLHFRHPLVRSAVVGQATDTERRRAHGALASSLAGHPDRAAWHLAAAASGPDEEVAAALQRSADHAVARGAPGSATRLLEWSAVLSVVDQRRGHRLLRAAELAFELGRRVTAERFMSEARRLTLNDADQARLSGLSAVFGSATGSPDDIRRIVSSAQRVVAEGDHALAAYLLVGAARHCHWGDVAAPLRELVLNAAQATLSANDPHLLQATAFLDPLGHGAAVVGALSPWVQAPTSDPTTATTLGLASFLVGDFGRTMTFVDRARAGLQQQGLTELSAQGLVVQAMAGIYLGRFAEADVAAQAAYELTRETHQLIWKALAALALGLLRAVHGNALPAVSLIDEAEETGLLTNNRALLNRVQFTRGLTALGVDQPTRSFGELRRMFDEKDPAYHLPQAVWGIDYLAESAVSDADRVEARALLDRADALSSDTSASGVRLAIALARAILAPAEVAERRFVEAAGLAAAATPWYRARLDLARGGWLGRQGRTTEARRTLRAAQLVFRALDTPAWQRRTERELVALEKSGQPTAPKIDVLSAQELQVAGLAARGLSNRDIAERLYLSHRTVASHLYHIYPKLGIRSRSQLHTVLPNSVLPNSLPNSLLPDARQARQ